MKIRPKIPIFKRGGLPSTVNWTDPNSTWFTRSGDFGILEGTYNYLKPLYDKWKSSGKLEDYLAYKKAVDNLNNNLRYGYAPGHLQYLKGNNLLFKSIDTGAWLNMVRRNYSFINDAIGKNYSKYHVVSNKPTSGDNATSGWKVDNLWAGETDDRTTWGNLLNPNDPNYQKWKLKFSEIGIDYRTNPEWNTGDVLYGFLTEKEPISSKLKNPLILKKEDDKGGSVEVNPYIGTTFDWDKIQEGFRKMYPGLLGLGRLAGTLISNDKIYGEALKGIRPDLKQSYLTHRQVVGDEATKLAYYRRAALGLTRAARPFTADADRLMAYLMEARRIGDELRALGDLADNAEIRRTSDESNQHQWANTLRNTEVANANIAALNYANALKHNLLALKHASNWSSINNYLLEKETRASLAEEEDKAIQNLIYALDESNKLATNTKYNDLYKKALEDINAGLTTSKNITDFKNYRTLLEIARLRNMPRRNSGFFLFAKRGASLEYKKKDDLLYRTARDVVDHFRRISKHASDSYNRRPIKLEKLTSHPKGSTKKYLLGGLAPFVVYTPAPIGGETKISSSLDGEKSGSKKDESLELVKNLFKEIGGNGLPVDVSLVFDNLLKLFNRHKILGTEITTEDIQSVYVLAMLQLSHIKYSLDSFNKLEQLATNNEALNEFAVTSDGRYIVSDENGNLSYEKNWKNILKEGKNPITNLQLLNMRAYSPKLALLKGDTIIDTVIANGMGINKIGAQIKALAGNLGASEGKLDGISLVESGKVKQGLQILANAPDGYYKHTITDKTLKEQVEAALKYIENMLSPSLRAILDTHGGTKPLIANFLASLSSVTHDATILPLTGKASDKDNSKESSEGLKLDAATALISGKGYLGAIEFNPGTSYAVTVNARHSGFLKKSGENMGSGITMLEATTSTLDKVLDWNKATLGGSRLNPTGYNRIMINSDDVVGVDLPIGSDKNVPDFTMLLKLQVLDLELLKKGIEDTSNNWKQINQVCLEIGLPAKYKNNGSLNEYSWNRFAAFQVTADDSVLVDKNAILSDILGVVEDDNVREQYELVILKDNKNYKLGSGFLGLGKQALYLGTVFVPINSSYVASALSGGLNISMLQATNLELRERGYDLLKIATYKPGININEL